MSQNPAIPHDPPPDGNSADTTVTAEGSVAHDSISSHAGHDGMPAINHLHEGLPEPHLNTEHTGYGHTDPSSLAALATLELHEPDLHAAEAPELDGPIWTSSSDVSIVVADPEQKTPQLLSQQPALLAHLAQVGLTSSDQWEEQIQPRIQKLSEDIAQVHVQLDELERSKPKKIS